MRFVLLFFILLLSCSCMKNANCDRWIGNYEYEEDPLQAIAGYNMAMIYSMNINHEKKDCIAEIQINGQQTFMILKAKVERDSSKISLKYLSTLDGNDYGYFKRDDNLFSLRYDKGIILTSWEKIEPSLREKTYLDSVYFKKK